MGNTLGEEGEMEGARRGSGKDPEVGGSGQRWCDHSRPYLEAGPRYPGPQPCNITTSRYGMVMLQLLTFKKIKVFKRFYEAL